ncbi:MAG: alpha amylase [Oscillospiraceae bacterium]|nr:alpha amylase [Oscillospiraceae bacterium]
MKRLTQLLCLLLVAAFLVGCAPQGQTEDPTTAPDSSGASVDSTQPQEAVLTEQAIAELSALGESPDDNYRVFYEIFVYSFCDSNGDGIGDLQGVISKLDYLQELGINGIWFMPIHPSQSYHKYDVRDYYDIDPDYGTMADMEQLLAECNARGINVITDLVLNHTGDDHEWFLTACEYLRNLPAGAEPDVSECPYVDYYYFSKEAGSGYHAISGSQWYYEGKFSPDMPDLNLGNETVRAEIRDIMQFWFDKGVSGFRLDAAKEFYSGDVNANVEVLSWIQETATSIKEDAYLVAEVWEGFGQVTNYYKSGITSLFNFPFGNTDGKVPAVVRGAGNAKTVSSYAKALEQADTAYLEANPNYIDAPFVSNHDVGRIAGFVARDELKMKMAGAMNVLMSGSCFIYYGEEIGMTGSGNDPSKRAPMYWNAERNNGVTDPPPECELPESYPLASAEEQRVDDSSLYNYYRQVIALRKAMPVISHGRTTAEEALNVNCISAQRKTWGEEECIILLNIQTEGTTVDLSAYEGWTLAASISADGNPITLEGTSLNMPAYGLAVLVPAE